jgi:hypothetical protein
MTKALIAASLVASFALTPDVAISQDLYSASAVLRGCRLTLGEAATTAINVYDIAFCSGEVIALMQISDALQNPICMPREATVDQARQVIVQYLDKIPERTHERFALLAVEALRLAWPCDKSQ